MNENKRDDKPNSTQGVGLPEGTKIGKYEIARRIGAGGQSVVYLAKDTMLDRPVAIKQISTHLIDDERFLKRFRAEAKILAKLGGDQSHIVAVYDLIEDAQGLFIAMEYVPGHTLAEVLGYQKLALPVEVTLEILFDVASGLKVAHDAGVVHRDIKPGNILVTRDHRARITDFGVAAQAGQNDSLSLGTTKYMAPEVFTGATVDERVDVYSLGFLAYEMLTGREFFDKIFADQIGDRQSQNLRWMKWHSDLSVEAPRLDEINPLVATPLADVVAKMMTKNPDDRYADMTEVVSAFREAIKQAAAAKAKPAEKPATTPAPTEDQPIDIPEEIPTSIIPRKPIPTRKKVTIAVVAAVVVIAAGITLAVKVGAQRKERRSDAIAAWQAGAIAYDKAIESYRAGEVAPARAGFEDAKTAYEAFIAGFGDFPKKTIEATAQAKLSAARLAMLDGDVPQANKLLKEAKEFGVLDAETITKFANAIELRADAVSYLNELAAAIEAEDFQRADSFKAQFGRLHAPPADQNLRAARLADELEEAKKLDTLQRALSACDEALAEAEAAATTDDLSKLAQARLNLDTAEDRYRQAAAVRNTPAVRERLTKLTEARSFVNAREAYVQIVASGAPLSEQIEAMKAVVNSRPATDALRDELAAAQAEEAYQRGMALRDGTLAGLRGASEAFAQSLEFKKLPKVVTAHEDVTAELDRRGYVNQANTMTIQKRHAEAVALLEKAQAIRDDIDVADQLAAARVQMHIAIGDAARQRKQWPIALAEYEKARQVSPEDEQVVQLAEFRAQLTVQSKEYYTLLSEGQTFLETGNFERAVQRLGRAEAIAKEIEVPADEAREAKTTARYQWEIAKGKTAEQSGDFKSALAFYRIAKRLMDTEEIRELIRKAEQARK